MPGKNESDVTTVEVEQQSADDAHVAKALQHVDSIVNRIVKAIGAPVSNAAPVAPVQTPAVPAVANVEKALTCEDVVKATNPGLAGADLESAIVNFEKATGFKRGEAFAGKKEEPEKSKTKKAAEPELEVDDDEPVALTLDSLASVITKAKVFTPGRVAELKKVQETLKLLLDGIEPGTSPATKTPAIRTHANTNHTAVLTKSLEPELVETLKNLAAGFEKMNERIESIEKARPAGNSLPETTTEGTKAPVQKAFWSGVL